LPASKKLHQERRFFNNRETRTVLPPERTVQAQEGGAQLGEFVKYCLVDLRIQRNTAQSYAGAIRRFLEACDFTVAGMREYLSRIENGYTYNDYLKAFIAYSRFLRVEPPRFRFSRMEPLLVCVSLSAQTSVNASANRASDISPEAMHVTVSGHMSFLRCRSIRIESYVRNQSGFGFIDIHVATTNVYGDFSFQTFKSSPFTGGVIKVDIVMRDNASMAVIYTASVNATLSSG